MTLTEALTILVAGNHGEINYHANDETRHIHNLARSMVGNVATELVKAHTEPLKTEGKATATWGDDAWYRAYHKDRTWPFT